MTMCTHDVVTMTNSSMVLVALYGDCNRSSQRWQTHTSHHSGVIYSRQENDLVHTNVGRCLGTVRMVADGVFANYWLPVFGTNTAGTNSACPACGEKVWPPKYETKTYDVWKRRKACIPCLYYMDRDDVAAINIVWRGVSAYEPAAVPAPVDGCGAGRRVAGDREQGTTQLVQIPLGAATVRFPYVSEGWRSNGSAKNTPHVTGDAQLLVDRPAHLFVWSALRCRGSTPRRLYASRTHSTPYQNFIKPCLEATV